MRIAIGPAANFSKIPSQLFNKAYLLKYFAFDLADSIYPAGSICSQNLVKTIFKVFKFFLLEGFKLFILFLLYLFHANFKIHNFFHDSVQL
jgi:hypothetical protein